MIQIGDVPLVYLFGDAESAAGTAEKLVNRWDVPDFKQEGKGSRAECQENRQNPAAKMHRYILRSDVAAIIRWRAEICST